MTSTKLTLKSGPRHRNRAIPLLAGLLVVVLVGLALAGCGEESTTTTSEAVTTSSSSATTSAPDTATSAPGSTETTTESTAGGDAGTSGGIAVTGLVASPVTLTVAQLEAMGTETVTVEHPKKGSVEYTGVRFSKVLEALAVQAEATTVTLTASDGYKVDVPLSSIESSADALLAIDEGTVSSVFPGLETQTWVKDIVAMEFK